MTELQQLVNNCYEQKDMNKKIEILYKVNSILPIFLSCSSLRNQISYIGYIGDPFRLSILDSRECLFTLEPNRIPVNTAKTPATMRYINT
jgi:hypothetical protein